MPFDEETLKKFKLIPNPYYDGDYGEGDYPKTLVEIRLIKMMGLIINKIDWICKLRDATIKTRWMDEFKEQGFNDKEIQYCMEELEYWSTTEPLISSIESSFQSDELIYSSLKQELKDFASQLENVDEKKKDWHPNSNNQVLDLIHPSLYCFVNGRTLAIDNNTSIQPPFRQFMGKGTPKTLKLPHNHSYMWIPAEVIVKDGNAKFTSYINNLHPFVYEKEYKVIESILSKFIPLFAKAIAYQTIKFDHRINIDPYTWYDSLQEPKEEDFANQDEYYEAADQWYEERIATQPSIPTFKPPLVLPDPIDMRNCNLQVIVKMANIHLTPNNPSYPGGSWHIEGTEAENICATGIYYYDIHNITDSYLQFRKSVSEPNYEQSDDNGVEAVFGLVNDEPLNQEMGHIQIFENRCICFPNMYQHRVEPFELLNKKIPGHRKIICFFLIRPSDSILSTSSISPQQLNWFKDYMAHSTDTVTKLPELVKDKIDLYTNWPMSLKEAKEHRLKLMEERKGYIENRNENLFEREFSLCEH